MLARLKRTYHDILMDYIKELSETPRPLLIIEMKERLLQINRYVNLLSKINACEDLGALRDLIVNLEITNSALYEQLWEIYKITLEDEAQLSHHLMEAHLRSQEQIAQYKKDHPESDDSTDEDVSEASSKFNTI